MKQNGTAAVAIVGSFVALALPIIGVAINYKYVRGDPPMFANYFLVLAPVSWLLWAVCKQRLLHQTDNRFLLALSWLNTALVFVFLFWVLLWLNRSCQHFTTIFN